MLFSPKYPLCLFHAGNEENKFMENTTEVFMLKEKYEMKEETKGSTRCKIGCTMWPRSLVA
jgi:hypothetical protein